MSTRALLLAGLLLATSGCSCDDGRGPSDASTPARDSGSDADAGDHPDVGPKDAGRADASAVDAGEEDAGEPDGGGPLDGGAPDSGAPPDPAECPVGVADGCCPLAVVYGGTDPDCPDLGCAALQESADVELDPLADEYHAGVGTAFDGRELWLAWPDTHNGVGQRYWFERRDVASGAITVGPTAHDRAQPLQFLQGVTTLALDPTSRTGFWVAPSSVGAYFRALFLAEDGAPTGGPVQLGRICNAFTVSLGAAWPTGGRPYSFGESDDCMGHSEARIVRVESDERTTTFTQASDRVFGGFAAYDAGAGRMHVLTPRLVAGYDEVFYATLDLATDTFSPEVRIPNPRGPNSSFEMAHAATDGQGLMIIGNVSRFQQLVGIVYETFVGRWDPAQGWGPVLVLSPPSAERRLGEARLIWTGAGYLAALTNVDGDGTSGGVTQYDNPEVELVSLSPSGALRQRWSLQPAGTTTVFPNLTWAGDRVAVTWVERTQQMQQHKLRWLSCP
jgi:hypothetical protein